MNTAVHAGVVEYDAVDQAAENFFQVVAVQLVESFGDAIQNQLDIFFFDLPQRAFAACRSRSLPFVAECRRAPVQRFDFAHRPMASSNLMSCTSCSARCP
jgi:hypothetical protein